MTIQEFSKLQAAMPTPELLEKARAWNSKLCATGGRAWSLRVPVSEDDPDMIFGEICRRLEIVSKFDFAFNLVNNAQALLEALEAVCAAQGWTQESVKNWGGPDSVKMALAAIAKAKNEQL